MVSEVNLNRYRIFCAVAECESISRAAEMLYISQPAISKSVTKLEENLNTVLFERNHRGVTLTYEGKILYEQIKTAFEVISSGEEKLQRINDLGIGRLRLGASTVLCRYMLLPYLKGYIDSNPHVKITIECQSSFHIQKLLEDGTIDIALMVKPENMSGIVFYSLGEIEDIFTATQAYLDNLQLRENKSLFEAANIMLLDGSNVTRQHIDRFFRENSIEPAHILEVTGMDMLIEFAKIGLGVACVIKQFVSEELENGNLVEIPINASIKKREVGFAFMEKTRLTSPMSKFIECFKR
jgi:DNA-binding transcriptional LysR family regulator